MKYIRKKIIEHIVFDGDIANVADIKTIIESIKRHEYDVEMRIKNEMVQHPKVRIIGAEEELFKYMIIGIGSTLVKCARYEDIDSLAVTTNDCYAAQTKPGISRWNLITPDTLGDIQKG